MNDLNRRLDAEYARQNQHPMHLLAAEIHQTAVDHGFWPKDRDDALQALDRVLAHVPDRDRETISDLMVAHKYVAAQKVRNLGEMLMLSCSELAEALEEDRDGRPHVWFKHKAGCVIYDMLLDSVHHPDAAQYEKDVMLTPMGGHLWGARCTCHPKPEGVAIEIMDAIIRLLDTGFDQVEPTPYTVDDLVRMKMEYNNQREHMHGKAY